MVLPTAAITGFAPALRMVTQPEAGMPFSQPAHCAAPVGWTTCWRTASFAVAGGAGNKSVACRVAVAEVIHANT